jgi:hypothetical protein
MIVPDGRTDLEKLKELLGNPEQTHLDLKASVDLTNAADKLNTSANFSYSAENRNIEFGLLIRDSGLAASIESTMASKRGSLDELLRQEDSICVGRLGGETARAS